MLTLHQFPISHYCEKARWALDFKQLDYEIRNLLPGPHLRATSRMAPRTSVPILEDGDQVVQGSAAIIDHLDQRHPERPLTPVDPAEAQEARDWEAYVDEELGVHVRRAAYNVLLDHPSIVLPFFTHQGPWYGGLLLKAIFPVLRGRMRQAMDINDETAEVSRERAGAALERIAKRLREHEFLVGDNFSRADLAAAALAAPLIRPQAYDLPWPDRFPDPIEAWIAENAEHLGWAQRLYREHRPAPATRR